MKVFNKLILGFILLLFSYYPLLAQPEYIDDAAVWISFNFEKKINKQIVINLNQQNRITENVSLYGRGNLDFGISYRLNKNIRIVGNYTFLKQPNLDLSYTSQHRAYAAVILKKNWEKWDFAYRNMFQIRMKNIYSSDQGKVPQYYNRNKITAKYDLNKYIIPFISQELFYPFYQALHKGFDKSRTAMGFDYKLSRKAQLEFYFLYQLELNASNAINRDFVYGVGFTQEL